MISGETLQNPFLSARRRRKACDIRIPFAKPIKWTEHSNYDGRAYSQKAGGKEVGRRDSMGKKYNILPDFYSFHIKPDAK